MFFDHVIIAVEELEQAVADYRALGFTVLRGGVHANRATHNALIVFEDGTYIELLARTGRKPTPGLADFSRLVEHGEGLVGFALGTDDIEAEARRLKTGGIVVSDILTGQRQREDGVLIQWRTMMVNNEFAPFFIQDITPRELRVTTDKAAITHANRAVGIASLAMVVRSMAESKLRYGTLFDLTPEFLQYRHSLPLKHFELTLNEFQRAQLSFDWETAIRNIFPKFARALEQEPDPDAPEMLISPQKLAQQMQDFMQQNQQSHRNMSNMLGDQRESLYSLTIAYEAAHAENPSIEVTHGVNLLSTTRVSQQSNLPLLDRMDAVDWDAVEHAYGPATDTPLHIRALVSEEHDVRDDAYEELFGSIVHQGSVYSGTLAALPFLIELAGQPNIADRSTLLGLIQACSGHGPQDLEDDDGSTVETSPCSEDEVPLYNALWDTFQTGIPTYLALLDDLDPATRYTAADTLSLCNKEQATIEAALLAHKDAETDPNVRANYVNALINLWSQTAKMDTVRFMPEQIAQLDKWRTDIQESPLVRFNAAIALIQHGDAEDLQRALETTQQLFAAPSDSQTFQHQHYALQNALKKHPAILLDWLRTQADHPAVAVRDSVASGLHYLAEQRRSATAQVVPILLKLAHDPSSTVRFTTINYLRHFTEVDDVRAALEHMSMRDTSSTIRERAVEILDKAKHDPMPQPLVYDPDLIDPHFTVAEYIQQLEDAERKLQAGQHAFIDQIVYHVAAYGKAAIQAVPILRRLLERPDPYGWQRLSFLRAVWHIDPASAEEILPSILSNVPFAPATLQLFQLFGSMGAHAAAALPLLKQFVESDVRGGGLANRSYSSEDIAQDKMLLIIANEAIQRIEQALKP